MTEIVTIDIAKIKRRAAVVAVIGMVFGGVLPGLLGIAALAVVDKDPHRAQMLTGFAWMVLVVGWLCFAGLLVLMLLGSVTSP